MSTLDTHLLTEQQKKERIRKAKQVLKMYQKYYSYRFSDLITGDETWVHFLEPKRKCSIRVWAIKYAKRPVIVKQTATVKKVLYCIFFLCHGPAIHVLVPRGRSVTAKLYKTLFLRN